MHGKPGKNNNFLKLRNLNVDKMELSLQKLFKVEDSDDNLNIVLSKIIDKSLLLTEINDDINETIELISLNVNFNLLYMFYNGKYSDTSSYVNTVEHLIELIFYLKHLESDDMLVACMLLKLQHPNVDKDLLVYDDVIKIFDLISLITPTDGDKYEDTLISNCIKYDYVDLLANNTNLITQKHFNYMCTYGNFEIIEIILQDITLDITEGFILACTNNHIDIANFLYNKTKLKDIDIKIILAVSSKFNYMDITELIINNREEFITNVFENAVEDKNIEQITYALELSSDSFLNIGDLFIKSIKEDDVEMIKTILPYYENMLDDKTLLKLIVDGNKLDMLSIFMFNGYENFEKLLDISVKSNNINTAKIALDSLKHVDPELLVYASKNSQVDMVKLILNYSVDIHVSNETPLREACLNGDVENVKLLLKLGSDKHILNDICFKNAYQNGHDDISLILEQ